MVGVQLQSEAIYSIVLGKSVRDIGGMLPNIGSITLFDRRSGVVWWTHCHLYIGEFKEFLPNITNEYSISVRENGLKKAMQLNYTSLSTRATARARNS
jgi:hypothetical protein